MHLARAIRQGLRQGPSAQGATKKLELLHAAMDVEDLRIPPGNRLERLKGDRKGQHNVRVNDQWRICNARRTVVQRMSSWSTTTSEEAL